LLFRCEEKVMMTSDLKVYFNAVFAKDSNSDTFLVRKGVSTKQREFKLENIAE